MEYNTAVKGEGEREEGRQATFKNKGSKWLAHAVEGKARRSRCAAACNNPTDVREKAKS